MRIVRHQTMVLEINGEENLPFRMVRTLEIELNKQQGTIPLIIGENIKPCPECGQCMSFAYDYYFCRNPECSFNKDNLGD